MMRYFEFNKEEISCLIEACENQVENYHEAIMSLRNCQWSEEYLEKMVKKHVALSSILSTFKGESKKNS